MSGGLILGARWNGPLVTAGGAPALVREGNRGSQEPMEPAFRAERRSPEASPESG